MPLTEAQMIVGYVTCGATALAIIVLTGFACWNVIRNN